MNKTNNKEMKKLLVKTIGDDLINRWVGGEHCKNLEEYVRMFVLEPLDIGESELLDNWIQNKTILDNLVELFEDDINGDVDYGIEENWLVEDKIYRILWDYLMWYLEDKLEMENKKMGGN